MDDPVSELRQLGLTVEIDEATAEGIWAELLSVHGHLLQGHYHKHHDPESGHVKTHFYEAYHAIARGVVVKRYTPDEIIEHMIPAMVDAFKVRQAWLPKVPLDVLTRWLEGPISEWKGKRLLLIGSVSASKPSDENDRLSAMIDCPSAARRLEAHLKANGIGQGNFAIKAGTTERTLRSFRRTGKIRRDLFESIAQAMGLSKDDLLKP